MGAAPEAGSLDRGRARHGARRRSAASLRRVLGLAAVLLAAQPALGGPPSTVPAAPRAFRAPPAPPPPPLSVLASRPGSRAARGALAPSPGVLGPKAAQPLPLQAQAGRLLRLYQPEFRAADELIEAARRASPALSDALQAATPWVSEPRAGAPTQVPTRILLAGSAQDVAQAEAVLRRFDLPDPMVALDVTVAEVRCTGRRQSGGHLRYDRDASAASPDALYRGTTSRFEPEAYLRGELTGLPLFQGTEVAFASSDGVFEYVLRALTERRESEYLARTTLVATENSPASLTSVVYLPSLVISGGPDALRVVADLPVQAGLELSVLPVRVGADGAVFDLVVRVSTAEPSGQADAVPGSLVQRVRALTTRVTARDGETLVLAGILLRRHLGDRRGLPLLSGLPALDAGLSARKAESEVSELLFVLRPRILALGRGPLSAEQ